MVGYKIKSIKKHTGLLRHKSPQDTGNIQKPVVSVYKSSYLEYQRSVCVWYVCACLRSCFTACHRGASSPWTLPRFSRPLLLLPSWKRPSPPFWPQGMIHAQTHATSVYPDPYHWNHSNQRAQIQVTSPFCTPGKRLLHLNFAGEDMQTSHNKPTSMPVCREPIQVVPSPLRHLPSAAQRARCMASWKNAVSAGFSLFRLSEGKKQRRCSQDCRPTPSDATHHGEMFWLSESVKVGHEMSRMQRDIGGGDLGDLCHNERCVGFSTFAMWKCGSGCKASGPVSCESASKIS